MRPLSTDVSWGICARYFFRLLLFFAAFPVLADVPAWPVPNCGRVYLTVGDGQHLTLSVATAGFSGTWSGPFASWVLVPVGSLEVSSGVGSAVTQDVGEGETWAAWPVTTGPVLVEQGTNGVLAAWAEGFGFGLALFGFGWVYRLTKKIPSNW